MSKKLNMSIELNPDSQDKDKDISKSKLKEHKWKELLYELFYEIKSEILGCKIEIEEVEYQECVKAITIPKLVNYIHDSIQILIQKKVDDSKLEQREEDEKFYIKLNSKNYTNPLKDDEKSKYLNLIKYLEEKERFLYKKLFYLQYQKESLDYKMGDYQEMEEEFEEMKAKLKYEDGRFLNNDRKENEIIIIRGENSNLKKTIKNLEEGMSKLEKENKNNKIIISNYENELKEIKLKLEEVQKQNEILNAHSINININNVTGTNKNNLLQNNNINNTKFNNNNGNNVSKYSKEEMNTKNGENKTKYKKIKAKIVNNSEHGNMSNTRIESSERTRSDILNKYFIGNKNNVNNNSLKGNHFNIGCNYIKSNKNSYIPYFNNNNKNMNYNIIKKIISSNSNNIRSSSTKVKGNPHGEINYEFYHS